MPRQPESSGAFVLSYRDVAKVLNDVNLGELIARLAEEIEAVYKDTDVSPVKRMGWSESPNAREIMACKANDFTCVKLISSIPAVNGSPTVTGTLICTDVDTEQARLVCDAAFLTPLRTAATSAVIMRQVVPAARSLGIVGAGLEGIAHALTLACMIDSIELIRLLDVDRGQAASAAEEIKYLLGRDELFDGRTVQIELCEDESDLYDCDALVTATFAEKGDSEVLKEADNIPDGTFIAAVGADLENKRELPESLYKRAKFIADDLQQCLEDGELQYAKVLCEPGEELGITDHRGSLAGGRILSAADFLANPQPFLGRDERITIYDSAGFSGQDLAMARVMIELLDRLDFEQQPWNPPGSRSLVDLLGCRPSS